jgi:carbonic anhydrase/acetyltransferase-like protein (isoleucine patch superfamily)
MIAAFGDHRPRIDATAYVPELAVVVGDVVIGPASRLWFHTVVRADVHHVRIGARSNVQDNATIHAVRGCFPTIVGDGVTVGMSTNVEPRDGSQTTSACRPVIRFARTWPHI